MYVWIFDYVYIYICEVGLKLACICVLKWPHQKMQRTESINILTRRLQCSASLIGRCTYLTAAPAAIATATAADADHVICKSIKIKYVHQ